MALGPVIDRSLSEKASRFLTAFGGVSVILGLDMGNEEGPGQAFNVEDNLNHEKNPDDVFIKIVTSLQMNTKDPGLHHLNNMSRLAVEGQPLDTIIKGLRSDSIEDVVGLCKDVLRGMDYIMRENNDREHRDSLSVAKSFVLYLEKY